MTKQLMATAMLALSAGLALGDGDGDVWVVSKGHSATTGYATVYESTTGSLVRTSQLMPTKVKVALNGNAVDITFDPVLSAASEAWLKRQINKNGKPGDVVLIPLAPSSITLTLLDPRGKKVVEKPFAGAGGGLAFDHQNPFTLRVTLPGGATPITAKSVGDYQLAVTEVYSNVKQAKTRFVSVRIVRSGLTTALEKVFGSAGGKIEESNTYVNRDVLQRLAANLDSAISIEGTDATPEMRKVVMDIVKERFQELVAGTPTQETYFVMTPGGMKLDIRPTSKKLEDHERAYKTEMETHTKAYSNIIFNASRDKASWKKLRMNATNSTDTSAKGAISAVIESVPFTGELGGNHKGSRTSASEVDEGTWDKWYDYFHATTSAEQLNKQMAASSWKGVRIIEGPEGKRLDLYKVADIRTAVNSYGQWLDKKLEKGSQPLDVTHLPIVLASVADPKAQAARLTTDGKIDGDGPNTRTFYTAHFPMNGQPRKGYWTLEVFELDKKGVPTGVHKAIGEGTYDITTPLAKITRTKWEGTGPENLGEIRNGGLKSVSDAGFEFNVSVMLYKQPVSSLKSYTARLKVVPKE